MDEMLERTAIEFTNLYRIVYVPCNLIPGFYRGFGNGFSIPGDDSSFLVFKALGLATDILENRHAGPLQTDPHPRFERL
jgi:hypothetical protein